MTSLSYIQLENATAHLVQILISEAKIGCQFNLQLRNEQNRARIIARKPVNKVKCAHFLL